MAYQVWIFTAAGVKTAIYKFLELMRKQRRVTDVDLDKVKSKGHITANETTALKKIKKHS
jgi:hypothetical protein